MEKTEKKISRRAAGILLACAAVLLGALAWLSASRPHYTYYRYNYLGLLDTSCTVDVYLTDKQDSSYFKDWIYEQILSYHRLFDAYHSYDGLNNVYTVNENAGKQAVTVDDALFDLVQFCLENRDATQERTNIAAGAVTSIWKQFMNDVTDERTAAKNEGREPVFALPSEESLAAAGMHMDMDCIILDEQARTIYLTDPHMKLDVGAVAKGYIAECLADQMREAGIESACINLGGNVKILGERKAEDGRTFFTTALRDPSSPQSDAYLESLILRLEDQACLVTSGNYERFVDIDGIRYSHLIDPDTLQPAHGMSSVTILATDSGLADYLSTALFTVDIDTGLEIVSHYEGVEVFWITEDYQTYCTQGFQNYLIK